MRCEVRGRVLARNTIEALVMAVGSYRQENLGLASTLHLQKGLHSRLATIAKLKFSRLHAVGWLGFGRML